jgi:hypothetical protein
VFFALSLIFLSFSIAVAFSWWGLTIGVPLGIFAVAVLDRVWHP